MSALRIAPALSLAFMVAGAATSRAEEAEHWRLFVGDHARPLVHAIDLKDGSAVGRFEISAPARLYASGSGRTIFAVQRDGDQVAAIDSGITIDDHGDHGDLHVTAPALLERTVAGDKPVHFVAHDGRIALFFDEEGVARVVTEKGIRDSSARPREVATPAPHHGFVAPFGKQFLASMPNIETPEDGPTGIRILDASGAAVGTPHPCPGVHGEAASGRMMAIACETGLLIAEPGEAGPAVRHVPYPDALPDGRKVSTLLGGTALQYFLGNYGKDAVVVIEPSETDAFRLVDLPTRRVDFVLDPIRARFAYIFTEDGHLRELDVVEARITRSIALTEPYSMDGHWSDPRPRLAVAGGVIAVTDPKAGVERIVDTEKFVESRRIEVEGMPYTIVAAGGSGETH